MASGQWTRREYIKGTVGTVAVGGIAGCSSNSAESQSYPAQEIQWVIPFSQGGGFDQASRAIAEYMPANLPNEVNIRPTNVTQGAGREAARTIYDADPTGYTIGMLAHVQTILHQFDGDVQWEISDFSYFGAPSTSIYTTVTGSDSPYQSIDDLRGTDEVRVGVQRPSGSLAISFNALAEALDVSYEFVSGYNGTDELYTAIARGDIDVAQGAAISASDAIDNDLGIRPLVVYREEVPELLADTGVASLADIGATELEAIGGEIRACCGPPELSDSRVTILEESLMDTIQSSEMQQWATDTGNILNPLTGDEVVQLIDEAKEILPQYRL